MKIRKKVLSVFCAAMLLGTITSVTVPQVQASDEQTKKVDGSYLTMQESASGTTQSEDAKGQYIMVGECSITKAGRNRIYVYAGTTANRTVNLYMWISIWKNMMPGDRLLHGAKTWKMIIMSALPSILR